MKLFNTHISLLFYLILIISLSSCQKPINYPQSLFSEAKVDSLLKKIEHQKTYSPLSDVFPPPKGEQWHIVAWITEYSMLKEKLAYVLKQEFPELDPTTYLNEIVPDYIDEHQWAMVLLPKNNPKNTAVIFFDPSSNIHMYPEFMFDHQFAAYADDIQMKMDPIFTQSRQLVFSFYPEFQLYGELFPLDYLDEGYDTLTMSYGFKVRRIAGCEEEEENQFKDADAHNQEMFELMVKRCGKDWLTTFESETGKTFEY
jgi:hypothetical protein